MTRRSIIEICASGETMKGRYARSTRKDKAKMLDEFVEATGLHRKASTRLLNRLNRRGGIGVREVGRRRPGRPYEYDLEVVAVPKISW